MAMQKSTIVAEYSAVLYGNPMNRPDTNPFRNLYLHVPFCSGKCTYCGFYSELFSVPKMAAYLDALERELTAATLSSDRPSPDTIYIGGGTPSLLSMTQWQRLCDLLHRRFNLNALSEWTVEANPGTITAETAALWREHGVSRVSLGVQSMCDATLARIHRRHQASETVETLHILRKAGFHRLGLDLIACLPDVTPAEWNATLQAVADLQPAHISVYACSIEPGSLLEQQSRQGHYQAASEEDEQQALDTASALLTARGFEQYETSNYALPGERCLYNLHVWQGEDYRGFGPAASSRVGLERWTNIPDLSAYGSRHPDVSFPRTVETLSPTEDAVERLMFNFRLSDAIRLEDFAAQHGNAAQQLVPFWHAQLEQLAVHGLVIRDDGHWRCTPQGARLADTIAEALLPDPVR